MTLDTNTVAFVAAAIEAVMVFVMFVLAKVQHRYKGAWVWFASTACASAAFFLYSIVSIAPASSELVEAFANSCSVWSVALMGIALDRFWGGKGRVVVFASLALVATAVLFVRRQFAVDQDVITSTAVTVVLTYISVQHFAVAQFEKNPMVVPAGIFMGVWALVAFGRIVLILFPFPTLDLIVTDVAHSLSTLTGVIATLLANWVFILLVMVRSLSDLNAAKKNADKSIEMKDRFFAILAHDLRGPVGGIARMLDFLCDNETGKCQEADQETILILKETASRTSKLLENLLLWAKTQNNEITLELQKVSLRDLLDETLGGFRASWKDKGIQLDVRIPESTILKCDLQMTASLIRNLLSNAVKFSHPGGQVTISAQTVGERVRILFVDRGIGMEKEKLDTLFLLDKNRSERGTMGEAGSGLGLVLCKEFATKQGGSLEAQSEVGVGTTMILELPSA